MRRAAAAFGVLFVLAACEAPMPVPIEPDPGSVVGAGGASFGTTSSASVGVGGAGQGCGINEIAYQFVTFSFGVAVDSDYVYWTENGPGVVARAKKCGGAPELLAVGQNRPGAIAVRDGYVYWANQGTGSDGAVMRLALDVQSAQPDPLAKELAVVQAIAVDGDAIYWATDGALQRRMLDVEGVETLVAGDAPGHGIALDDTHLYWPERSGEVRRIPKDGGAPETLGTSLDEPWCVAVDATDVYWTTYNASSASALMKAPKAGGEATLVANGVAQRCLTLGPKRVYWASDLEGLRAAPKEPGPAVTISAHLATFLALDGTRVYGTGVDEVFSTLR